VIRTYEVDLTIPDNTAYTALVALERLGIDCDEVRRADVYLFEVDDDAVAQLDASIRTIETIYNPNKHRLRAREPLPAPGEVWVGEGERPHASKHCPMGRIAGRTLRGVRSLERFVSWRLRLQGSDVPHAVVMAASDGLLCNPAYQFALITESAAEVRS